MTSLYLQTALLLSAFFHSGASTPSLIPLQRPNEFYPVTIPDSASGAGEAVLESFLSYSIEFAFFPDFGGNKTSPNTFSNNLLNNLASFQGLKPDIRVGGNTQ